MLPRVFVSIMRSYISKEIKGDSSNRVVVDTVDAAAASALGQVALGGGRPSWRRTGTAINLSVLHLRLLFGLLHNSTAALCGIVPIVLDLKHGATRNVLGDQGPVFWLPVLRGDSHDGCLFLFGKLGLIQRWIEMVLVPISHTFSNASRQLASNIDIAHALRFAARNNGVLVWGPFANFDLRVQMLYMRRARREGRNKACA